MRTMLLALAALLLLSCSCARKRTGRVEHVYVTKEERNNIRKSEQTKENKESQIVHPTSEESSNQLPQLLNDIPQQIISRLAYTVSYNSDTKCANWVAWHLTREHTDGPYPRKGIPYYDEDGTAIGVGMVTNDNYRNGYFIDNDIKGPRQEFSDWNDKSYHVNHGHLCPAGDNRWSKAAMNQSFYLSNICPQDIDLNGGDWEGLERRCRGWANQFGDIYIIAGPVFYNENYRTIGEGKIGVPDAFFKVILRKENAIGKSNPQALGFLFPNEGTHHELLHYKKSIDEIEEITGFDFFSHLPDSIESEVEAASNLELW